MNEIPPISKHGETKTFSEKIKSLKQPSTKMMCRCCNKNKNVYMAFGNKLSFPETIQFCRRLDGEIATTRDSKSSAEIKEAFERLTNIEQVRYLGVTRLEFQ